MGSGSARSGRRASGGHRPGEVPGGSREPRRCRDAAADDGCADAAEADPGDAREDQREARHPAQGGAVRRHRRGARNRPGRPGAQRQGVGRTRPDRCGRDQAPRLRGPGPDPPRRGRAVAAAAERPAATRGSLIEGAVRSARRRPATRAGRLLAPRLHRLSRVPGRDPQAAAPAGRRGRAGVRARPQRALQDQLRTSARPSSRSARTSTATCGGRTSRRDSRSCRSAGRRRSAASAVSSGRWTTS